MAPNPILTEQLFAQMIELSPQQAASLLLTAHGGDDTRCERLCWATWNRIVGGDLGNRKGDGMAQAEAKFLVEVVRAIVDGHEDPPVAQQAERRRTMQGWIASGSSASTHVVGAAA